MRRRTMLGSVAMVLMACATLALHASASSALRPDLRVVDAPDSVIAMLSWSPVRDARNEEVAYYVPSLINNGVIVASAQTTDTIFRVAIEKVAGDSMSLVGEVYAVDVRGNEGAVARTAPFVVIVPDPGPPAPEIRLDTIAVVMERIDSLQMFFPAANFDDQGRVVAEIGDTIQGCVVAWRGNVPFRPSNQAPVCLDNTFPAMLYRPMLNGFHVRQAE